MQNSEHIFTQDDDQNKQEQYTLLLAGALLSITLNPFLFRALPWVEAHLRKFLPSGPSWIGMALCKHLWQNQCAIMSW